jgi:hypothetical protein
MKKKTMLFPYHIGRLGFARREAPRSQVQEVVYTDGKKLMLAYLFQSTLARPQKVETFQILGKV